MKKANAEMRIKYRFAFALALACVSQLFIIGVFIFFMRLDMAGEQRVAVLAALVLFLLLALGIGLHALFNAWLVPVTRLADDTVLLAANPRHRATPRGAHEVCTLAGKLNALADAHQMLHDEVQARIDEANRALTEERNRLAALTSELALSVLVCNIEGRILLYNARARQMLGAPAIGLGRSIFGAIDRGLVVHALEQIQHRLHRQQDDSAYPISRFVATLAQGQIVRANMAPALGSGHTLDGFVLTLEDISRNIEADSHRDALLQSLTQDTRSALANIRAAVEAMQAFPDMSGAKRAQFTAVVDDESRRLVRETESAMRQHGDHLERSWELEDMRGADLVALLLRRIDVPSLRAVTCGAIDETLWVNMDSYAMTQALMYLAKRLSAELGATEFCVGLQRAGRLAHLDLAWRGAPLTSETLRAWEDTPMQISAAGTALTLEEVIARHGGEAVYRFDPLRRASCYRLMLPIAEPQETVDVAFRKQARPEFYDFDLFHQPGQTDELDRRPLSQLSYTVFDTETTGLHPAAGDEIISIGALRVVNGRLLQQESFEQLIRPRHAISPESIGIHGITESMLKAQPLVEHVLPKFFRFADDTVLVAHNAAFDMRFLQMQEARSGVTFTQPVLDTLLLSQVIHPHQERHTLEAIAARVGVAVIGRHTALGDAIVTGEVFLKMIPLMAEKGIVTLKDAREASQQTLYARVRY